MNAPTESNAGTRRAAPEWEQELTRFLNAFTSNADAPLVVELRALDVPQKWGKPATECGFFDLATNAKPFIAAVGSWNARDPEDQPSGIYVFMNPVNDALIARANNRIKPPSKKAISAGDKDVIRRRWVVIDVDPTRPSGVSATDDEKLAARTVLDGVRGDLRRLGWPEPMVIDSGNGGHVWYRVDLPADDGGLIERLLKSLACSHDTAAATVDTSVFNASRIMKLPGTMSRKGDSIPTRPHRMARVLVVPDVIAVTPAELIELVAGEAPKPNEPKPKAPPGRTPPVRKSPVPTTASSSPCTSANGTYTSRLLVEQWLHARGVSFSRKDRPASDGRTVFVFAECPFDASHVGLDSCVMQAADGSMSAHCFHASCQGRGWQDFKTKIGAPDAAHYHPLVGGKPRTVPSIRDALTNGTRASAHTSKPAPTQDGSEAGVVIILDYFRTRYRPDYKRGTAIHNADGGMIAKNEACALPDSNLIERLKHATNAPKFKGDHVNENALP